MEKLLADLDRGILVQGYILHFTLYFQEMENKQSFYFEKRENKKKLNYFTLNNKHSEKN